MAQATVNACVGRRLGFDAGGKGKSMRLVLIAALLASQTVSAAAASLESDRRVADTEIGSFAGARLRLDLGGPQRGVSPRDRFRAGLVVAPTMSSQRVDGGRSLRFGEGLEYGVRGTRAAGLAIAGRPIARRGDAATPERRAGVSTLGWVAIGVGAVVTLVIAASVICLESNCIGSK